MSTFTDKVAALMAIADRGEKVHRCEYYKIEWAAVPEHSIAAETKYYGHSAYSRIPPFRRVKRYTGEEHIEARILDVDTNYPFKQFELQPDIRTKEIPFEFDDTDATIELYGTSIRTLFADHGTSRIRIYHYFPQADLNVEVWTGQIQNPAEKGDYRSIKTIALNDARSRELQVPNETHPKLCPFRYAELFSTLFAQESGGCPVNTSVGGSIGVGGFAGCPKDPDACDARLGSDQTPGSYNGGWTVEAATYTSDPHLPGLTRSTSSNTLHNQSKRWLAGRKHINNMPLVSFAREPNPQHPEQGFINLVAAVSIGPVVVNSIMNPKVNGLPPNIGQWAAIWGRLGQGRVDTLLLQTGLSGTALLKVRINLGGNPLQFNAQNISVECDALGYEKVAVFTDADTYSRIWTDKRIWWLLELHTNQRAGMGLDKDEFWLARWVTEAAYHDQIVTFTQTHPDGEEQTYPHRFSTFNELIEGSAFDEHVLNICRSGRIHPPYLYQGKYAVATQRPYSSDELAAAPTFSDRGNGRKIVWDSGMPSIAFNEVPEHELVNKLQLSFDEYDNKGLSRPITIEDPDQQLRAGRSLGNDTFREVPYPMTAFGVDSLGEALPLGYWILFFGRPQEKIGGIHNNSQAVFFVPYEYTLDLERYQVIKIDSALNTKLTPDGDAFEYFTILEMMPAGRNWVMITAQGYNRQKVEAFETGDVAPSSLHALVTTDAGDPNYIGTWPRGGINFGKPWYQKGTYFCEAVWDASVNYYRYQFWPQGGGTVYAIADSEADYPWDTTFTIVTGTAPAPTCTEGGTNSPDPAPRPLTPPVATNIDIGTIVQGADTITIPIEEV